MSEYIFVVLPQRECEWLIRAVMNCFMIHDRFYMDKCGNVREHVCQVRLLTHACGAA